MIVSPAGSNKKWPFMFCGDGSIHWAEFCHHAEFLQTNFTSKWRNVLHTSSFLLQLHWVVFDSSFLQHVEEQLKGKAVKDKEKRGQNIRREATAEMNRSLLAVSLPDQTEHVALFFFIFLFLPSSCQRLTVSSLTQLSSPKTRLFSSHFCHFP